MLDCIFRFTYRFRLPDNACLPAELEASTEIQLKKKGNTWNKDLAFLSWPPTNKQCPGVGGNGKTFPQGKIGALMPNKSTVEIGQ